MSRRIAIVGAGLGAAVLAVWLLTSGPRANDRPAHRRTDVDQGEAPEPRAVQAPGVAEEVQTRASDAVRTSPSLDSEGDETRREEVAVALALTGTLVDEEGSPVADAVVSWTPLPTDLEGAEHPRDVSALVEAETVVRTSDRRGAFGFERAPASGDRGSAVWITHARHAPRVIVLPPRGAEPFEPIDERMARAPSTRARVVRASGDGVRGAVVEQVAVGGTVDAAIGDRTATESAKLPWLLRRSTTTDAQGRAELQAMPGMQEAIATDGERASATWTGVASGTVTLTIDDPIQVGGQVHRAGHLEQGQEILVSCDAVKGERTVRLEELVVESDRWGPVELPFLDADEYVVRLHGENLVPKVARFRAEPGESRLIDFEAEYGYAVWFYVVDEDDEILPEAEVTLGWRVDGRLVEKRASGRPDGYIGIAGIPAGTVEGQLRCPGYAPLNIAALQVPDPEDAAIRFVLSRAGVLRGTCTARGVPVADFDVHVWPVGAPAQAATHPFSTTDGSFEIAAAPEGPVTVCATAAGVGISDPVRAEVGPEDVEAIELALVTDVRVHGLVVDAETSAPIPDATATVLLGVDYNPLADIGVPVRSDAGGRVELTGLSRGEGLVRVGAPGYGSTVLTLTTVAGEDVDLGVVALPRKYPLVIDLRATEVDPTSVVLYVRGPQMVATRSFDPSGRIRLDAVDAGLYGFRAELPGGMAIETSLDVRAGHVGYAVLDARGACTLHLEVVGASGEPLRGAKVVALNFEGRQNTNRSVRLDKSGRATLRSLPSGAYHLDVRSADDPEGAAIASSRVVLTEGVEDSVRIAVGQGDLVLRVVDGERRPVAGADVAVNVHENRMPWARSLTTDAHGECVARSVDGRSLLVHVSHPAHGYRVGVEVDAGSPDVVEIELAGDVDGAFVVSTARGPAVGIETRLFDGAGGYGLPGQRTDSSGAVTWHGLTPGDYVFQVTDIRYWPTTEPVRVERDRAATPIRTRLRCSARILLRSKGLPVAGAPMGLEWIDGPRDVAELVADKTVVASDDELRTSAEGTLRIDQVPEGTYRWTVALGDETHTGVFDVLPRVENEAVIDLP